MNTESVGERRYWVGPPNSQIPEFTTQLPVEEADIRWGYNPFEFYVLPPQHEVTAVQQQVVNKIINRLTADDLGNRHVAIPTHDNPGNHPKIALRIGPGRIDAYTDPRPVKDLPDLPLIVLINVVDELPATVTDFHIARRQIIRTNCQNGCLIKTNPNTGEVESAVWMSMQGNRKKIEAADIFSRNSPSQIAVLTDDSDADMEVEYFSGSEKEIIDNIVLRAIVHSADDFLVQRGDTTDVPPELKWGHWVDHPVHDQLHQLAQELNATKVESSMSGDTEEWKALDDDIPLYGYVDLIHKISVKLALEIMHREGLGEGMYFQYIPELAVVAFTPSGPHKVIWDTDAATHPFLRPVTHRTANGYLIGRPVGMPDQMKYKENSSVETAEGLDAVHALQLLAMGKVKTFTDFKLWQKQAFEKYNGAIPTRLPGSPAIPLIGVHVHISQKEGIPMGGGSEVVTPDLSLMPDLDMACGTRGGSIASLSALFKSRLFTGAADRNYEGEFEHPLGDNGIWVALEGHGGILYAKDVETALHVLHNYMTPVRPAYPI